MLFEKEIKDGRPLKIITVNNERTLIHFGRILEEDETHVKVFTTEQDRYPNQYQIYKKTEMNIEEINE